MCDKRYQIGLATSIYFSGVFVGGLIFGAISDRIGRYPMFVTAMYSHLAFSVMVFFVDNFVLFNILRFFAGMTVQVRSM